MDNFESVESNLSGRSASSDHLKPNQIPVPVITKAYPYEVFYETHLVSNFPCIIQNIGRDWKASKLWCQNGKPCFKYLEKQYGDSIITVHHCEEKYNNSHTTSKMKFKEYLEYWKKYNDTEDKTCMKLLYLKDWHMKNEYKDDEFYEVPIYFSSDWLNEYLVAVEKDDYRFVYMGPAGSWSPVHKDVLNTFSWSVNICGLKRWILFPPGEEKKIMNGSQLRFTITQVPNFVEYCEIMQHPGDAVFVPSGWHHIVWNLEDTISINHNWVNGSNIKYMATCLQQSLLEVEKELINMSKEENFQTICQDVLKQHAGMNHEDFFDFIRFIAIRRMSEHVKVTNEESLLHKKNLNLYDLNRCREILASSLEANLCPKKRKEADELLKKIASVTNQ